MHHTRGIGKELVSREVVVPRGGRRGMGNARSIDVVRFGAKAHKPLGGIPCVIYIVLQGGQRARDVQVAARCPLEKPSQLEEQGTYVRRVKHGQHNGHQNEARNDIGYHAALAAAFQRGAACQHNAIGNHGHGRLQVTHLCQNVGIAKPAIKKRHGIFYFIRLRS